MVSLDSFNSFDLINQEVVRAKLNDEQRRRVRGDR
jgi:hypothetical protein